MPRMLRPVRDEDAPLPRAALDLLARSDAELVAAGLSGSAEERFLHAHFAALRAGASLLEVTGRPGGRPRPRTVWDMVSAVAPELSEWAAYFASGAPIRAAIESGRDTTMDEDRAEAAVAAAEDFQERVRAVLDARAGRVQGALALRAS